MGRLLGVGWERMGVVGSSWMSLCVFVFVFVCLCMEYLWRGWSVSSHSQYANRLIE